VGVSSATRSSIVAADARRRGFGRGLMRAVRAALHALGVAVWSLNVKPDNLAAIDLYEQFGMKPLGETSSLRFPWSLVDLLPEPDVDLLVRDIDPAEDTIFEGAFDLPPGRLATSRARTGRQIVGLFDATTPAGLAVFFPALPSTFPFRVARPSFAGPLFKELRKRADSAFEFTNVALDDDPALSSLLVARGAEVVMTTLRYGGPLVRDPASSPTEEPSPRTASGSRTPGR
jgi:acetyltransferase (GNAT) family protein